MKLTRRGHLAVAWTALAGFLIILGTAGWIEGL